MLLNGVEIPILLGLSFRHNLNDPPANISALTWHLLSLLLFPTRSVGDSNFSLGVMNSILKEWSVFILRNDIPVDEPSTFFSSYNLKLYAVLTAFLSLEVSITLKKKTKQQKNNQPKLFRAKLLSCSMHWCPVWSEADQWTALHYTMASWGLC